MSGGVPKLGNISTFSWPNVYKEPPTERPEELEPAANSQAQPNLEPAAQPNPGTLTIDTMTMDEENNPEILEVLEEELTPQGPVLCANDFVRSSDPPKPVT